MLGIWFYLILELLTLDLWIISAKNQVSGIELKWRGCNQYKIDFHYEIVSRYLWIRIKVLIVDQNCERILNSGTAAYPVALSSTVFSFRSLPFPLYLPVRPIIVPLLCRATLVVALFYYLCGNPPSADVPLDIGQVKCWCWKQCQNNL